MTLPINRVRVAEPMVAMPDFLFFNRQIWRVLWVGSLA